MEKNENKQKTQPEGRIQGVPGAGISPLMLSRMKSEPLSPRPKEIRFDHKNEVVYTSNKVSKKGCMIS